MEGGSAPRPAPPATPVTGGNPAVPVGPAGPSVSANRPSTATTSRLPASTSRIATPISTLIGVQRASASLVASGWEVSALAVLVSLTLGIVVGI